MAKNIRREIGNQLDVAVTHPVTPASGDPCRWNLKVGVALANKNANGLTSVKFDGTALLTVKAINAGGNSPVVSGDQLFYTDADTPPISKKATGTLVGQAMDVVATGATAIIEVRLEG